MINEYMLTVAIITMCVSSTAILFGVAAVVVSFITHPYEGWKPRIPQKNAVAKLRKAFNKRKEYTTASDEFIETLKKKVKK